MAVDHSRVILLLEKKRHVLEAYLSETRQLALALSAKDVEAVEGHIRNREEMTRIIDRLDRQARRYPDPGKRGIAAEIRKILTAIVKADKACETAAKSQYDSLKKTLTAAQGYGQRPGKAPKLLNIQT